jgi:transposase
MARPASPLAIDADAIDADALYTAKQIAAMFGISIHTFYTMRRTGYAPDPDVRANARRVYWRGSTLYDWHLRRQAGTNVTAKACPHCGGTISV